jgi:transcriptional regulator with XRE-family HTH domain
MYGGALPVAKSRKIKRKTLTKAEYLDDAPEEPRKKKAKKAKVASKVEVISSGVPNIQEEVHDLDADKVLKKGTRSGKSVGSSQTQTSEIKSKKVAEEDSLQKANLLAQDIGVPVEQLLKDSTVEAAQMGFELTENLQQLVVSGDLLEGVEKVQEENVGRSEADASEASRGNLDSLHSTLTSHSTSLSNFSTSSVNDNIPIGRIYTNLHKSLNPSPSSKLHKKPAHEEYVPMYHCVQERIHDMAQMRFKVCEKLPANHPFQPPMIEPLSFVPADAEVIGEQVGSELANLNES